MKTYLKWAIVSLFLFSVILLAVSCQRPSKNVDEQEDGAKVVGVNDDGDDDSDYNEQVNDDNQSNENTDKQNNNTSNADNKSADGDSSDNSKKPDNSNKTNNTDNEGIDASKDPSLQSTDGGTVIGILFQNIMRDGTYDNVTKVNKKPSYEETSMEWNVRRPVMKKMLSEYNADIMGFTEVTWGQKADLAFDFPTYTQSGQMRYGNDYEGSNANEVDLILFRTSKFELIEEETFWLSDTPNVVSSKTFGGTHPTTINSVFLKLKSSDKEKIMYYNTQLPADSSSAREKAGALISDIVDDWKTRNPGIPIFLTGDFNSEPGSAAYNNIHYALQDATVFAKNKDTGATYPSIDTKNQKHYTSAYRQQDLLFYEKDNVEIDTYEAIKKVMGDICPSDHYAIYAKVRIYPYAWS